MKRLGTKMLVMMLSITFIGMIILTIAGLGLFHRYLVEQSLNTITQSTLRESERINGWLNYHVYYVDSFANELTFVEDLSRDNIFPRLRKHISNELFTDIYIGLPDGTVIMSTGFIPNYSEYDATQRPWYTTAMSDINTIHVSEPYIEIETQEYCIAISKAIVRDGQVVGVVGADLSIDMICQIVDETSVGTGSHAFLTDSQGFMLHHPYINTQANTQQRFQNILHIEDGAFESIWANTIQQLPVSIAIADGVNYYYTYDTIPVTNWRLYTAIPASVVRAPLYQLIAVFIAISIIILIILSVIIAKTIRRLITKPALALSTAASNLAEGNTDISIDYQSQNEIGDMIDAFLDMAQGIKRQAEITKQIAAGDLTGHIEIKSNKDIMGQSLNRLVDNFNYMIKDIINASSQVATGSKEISSNTQLLSQNTSEQAASMQEIMTLMQEIIETIYIHEVKNKQTMTAGAEVSRMLKNSVTQLHQTFAAINEITTSSSDISNIIKAIDDIAFQTKILSINAAIEASSAGIYGKGFAVVAEEIRRLATKSAEAAKQTGILVEESIIKAKESAVIAEKTEDSMKKIMDSIAYTTELVSDLGIASINQTESIRKLNQAIEQINQSISINASSTEECAAASEALYEESKKLIEVVHHFTLDTELPELPHFTPQTKPDSEAADLYYTDSDSYDY